MSDINIKPGRKFTFVIVIAVLLGLILVTFSTMVSLVGIDQRELATSEFTLSWIIRIVGAFIAVIAAVTMLVQTICGVQPITVILSVCPFFAGLALFHTNWSGVFALAAVVISYIVAYSLTQSKSPPGQ